MVWPRGIGQLRQEQRRLAALSPPPWHLAVDARIGACFVCFAEDPGALAAGAEAAWSAAVTFHRARRTAAAVVEGATAARYRSGLLALRAGPLLERAVASLPLRPDVLLVNATGRDHPRRAGLALHLGAVLDLPTVGVTDRPLSRALDEFEELEPGAADGGDDAVPLRLAGVDVAYLVPTRSGSRPLVVHAAWRTDAVTALAVVRAVAFRERTPAPLREARRLARTARAAARGEAPWPPGDPGLTRPRR